MQLTKHHGLGNDFLVVFPDGADAVGADEARRWCDRRTGVGADGLISARPDGERLHMRLWNSDGSEAELSGNGMRCLVQAARLRGLLPGDEVVIATVAGDRPARILAESGPGTHRVAVDMGSVTVDEEAGDWLEPGVVAAAFADVGNPHLVLHVPDPAAGPELVDIGSRANAALGGINVELVRVTDDGLALSVFERGAGVTEACGSGACAAAVVAHAWELVGPSVDVAMPGGSAHVDIGGTVHLTGPTTVVASLQIPPEVPA